MTQAIEVLSSYLTSSPTAPLNKEFIEIESPFWYALFPPSKIVLTGCSTYIYLGEENRATRSDLLIYVGSVPTEHLHTFDAKLHESFRRIVKDGVDLHRMQMVLDRDERQVLFRSVICLRPSNRFQVPQQAGIRWGRRILIDYDR